MSNCPVHSGEKDWLMPYNNRDENDIPAKAGEELDRNGEGNTMDPIDINYYWKMIIVYSQSRDCSIICNFLNLRINLEADIILFQ
jgi:hypothetical protein